MKDQIVVAHADKRGAAGADADVHETMVAELTIWKDRFGISVAYRAQTVHRLDHDRVEANLRRVLGSSQRNERILCSSLEFRRTRSAEEYDVNVGHGGFSAGLGRQYSEVGNPVLCRHGCCLDAKPVDSRQISQQADKLTSD